MLLISSFSRRVVSEEYSNIDYAVYFCYLLAQCTNRIWLEALPAACPFCT